MHPAAYEWVASHVRPQFDEPAWGDDIITAHDLSVLDIGGRDINGSPRALYGPDYTVIDIVDGPGVDIVADVTSFTTRHRFDVIVCCEVLEHTDADVIGSAHRLLRKGGTLILTAAGPGREPHSAIDGGRLRDGEFYRNVTEPDLARMLKGWRDVTIDILDTDIRAVATK